MAGFHEKTTQTVFNDSNRGLRLPLLVMAVVLLIGGGWLWISYRQQKEEPVSTAAVMPFKGQTIQVSPVTPFTSTLPSLPGSSPHQSATNLAATNPAGGTSTRAASTQSANKQKPTLVNSSVTTPASVIANTQALSTTTNTPGAAQPQANPDNTTATVRQIAAVEARVGAGRPDPSSPLKGLEDFPRSEKKQVDDDGESASQNAKEHFVPPPPATALQVPPPPSPDMGLSIGELPAPPAKPSIANKMKLVAVMGDRAVLAFTDRMARVENHWPRTVTLGAGDKFESVSIINVSDDSVVIDEDGDRSVKSIERVK